jgi:hypothetical protein
VDGQSCQGLVFVVAGTNVVVVVDRVGDGVGGIVSGGALVAVTGVVVVDAAGELVELGLTVVLVVLPAEG